MNSNTVYRQSTIPQFGHRQTQESLPPGSPNVQQNNDVPTPVEPPTSMPPILIRTIAQLAQKYAAITCKSSNLVTQVSTLVQDKEQGNIPKQLQYKFKNFLNNDSDTSLRSAVIVAAIDAEILRLNSKVEELNNLFNNRYQDLEHVLLDAIKESNLICSNEQVGTTFDNFIREKKLEFILKQKKDLEKKFQKKEKFLLKQEEQNAVAILSVKQVNAFKNEIEALKNQLKKVKLSPPKNKKGKGKPKHPKKSTGPKKGRNGKPKSTVRNK
jgi:hypothetical protein